MSFGFGPEWARNTQCCAKPHGCTNMSDQCLMLNHPWKRWHRETYGPRAECPAKHEEPAMTIAVATVADAIRANAGHLPKGLAAGYTTGHGTVPWGAAEWKAHPGAVRICQDPGATDETADILDVESGAATVGVAARWAEAAAANFAAGKRPGQRRPAVYMSLSMVTPVVNALIHGGISEGVGLWVANWNLTEAEATALVQHAGGPFPVIGVQYRNAGLYDVSVFSQSWLQEVSVTHPAAPPVPPGPWNDPDAWNWTDVAITGVGLDGKLHLFHLEHGTWVKIR